MKQKNQVLNCLIAVIMATGLAAFAGCEQNVAEDNGDQSSDLAKSASILTNAEVYQKVKLVYQSSTTSLTLYGPKKANESVAYTIKGPQGGTATVIWFYTWDAKTRYRVVNAQFSWNDYKARDVTLNGSGVYAYNTIAGGTDISTIDFIYADLPGTLVYDFTIDGSGIFKTGGSYTVSYNGETQTYGYLQY